MGYIWLWRAYHGLWSIGILGCLLLSHAIHHFVLPLIFLALAMLAGGLLINATRRMAPARHVFF